MWIFIWIITIIAVEALTEILVSSELLMEPRNHIAKINQNCNPDKNPIKSFLMEKLTILIGCGYCMSMWVSIIPALFLPNFLGGFAGYVINLLVLHRMSNIFHIILKKLEYLNE